MLSEEEKRKIEEEERHRAKVRLDNAPKQAVSGCMGIALVVIGLLVAFAIFAGFFSALSR